LADDSLDIDIDATADIGPLVDVILTRIENNPQLLNRLWQLLEPLVDARANQVAANVARSGTGTRS